MFSQFIGKVRSKDFLKVILKRQKETIGIDFKIKNRNACVNRAVYIIYVAIFINFEPETKLLPGVPVFFPRGVLSVTTNIRLLSNIQWQELETFIFIAKFLLSCCEK